MKKILVIGSTVTDVIINVDFLPSTAQDVHIISQNTSLGGCAHNVSDSIRHFDVPYLLFSPVGTGIYGDYVRAELAKKGLTSPVPTPNQANGCCYCFVETSGERTFIVDRGAEYRFYKEWFDNLNLEEFSHVYFCGLELEEPTGGNIVDFLEKCNLPIFFATGPRITQIDKDMMHRLFALRPVLHLNDSELCQYTGINDLEQAADFLYQQTNNTIIITLGSKGACFYDNDGIHYVAPVKAEHLVDTIGAGDSHFGSVIACLLKGMPMEAAIANANKVASAVVCNKGALLDDEVFQSLF